MWEVGLAYLTARKYDDAVEWSERAIQRHPENPLAYLVLASSLAHLGHVEDARTSLETYRGLMPNRSEQPNLIWRYKHEADEEHFLDGLRKAGSEG